MNPLREGSRLPALSLPATVPPQHAVHLRTDDRRATVLLALHADCAPCADYAGALAARNEDISGWDGRIVVALDGAPAADLPAHVDAAVEAAVDAAGALGRAGMSTPAVLVADQWGEIFFAVDAGTAHSFPDIAELVNWLRYLATQCPECEGEAL